MKQHVFKVFKVNDRIIIKEGLKGTGLTLPFHCSFCRDKSTRLPTQAFRSRRERNMHTNKCNEGVPSYPLK